VKRLVLLRGWEGVALEGVAFGYERDGVGERERPSLYLCERDRLGGWGQLDQVCRFEGGGSSMSL